MCFGALVYMPLLTERDSPGILGAINMLLLWSNSLRLKKMTFRAKPLQDFCTPSANANWQLAIADRQCFGTRGAQERTGTTRNTQNVDRAPAADIP